MANNVFSARMDRIAAGVSGRIAESIKLYAGGVLTHVIENTPYKSGQARANWQVAIGSTNSTFIELRDASRKGEYDAADVEDAKRFGLQTISKYKAGQKLTIFNNAPYIVRLNEGWSKQAPAGFIEAAIADVNFVWKKTGVIG